MEIDATTVSNVMRAIASRRKQTMTAQRRSQIAQFGGKAAWATMDRQQRLEIMRKRNVKRWANARGLRQSDPRTAVKPDGPGVDAGRRLKGNVPGKPSPLFGLSVTIDD